MKPAGRAGRRATGAHALLLALLWLLTLTAALARRPLLEWVVPESPHRGGYLLFVILLVAVAGLVLTMTYRKAGRILASWGASAVLIGSAALFGVVGIFPALLPSSLNPAYSLTIQNSSSSPMTLAIMLGVALVFVPIVAAYQFWLYRTVSHKVTEKELGHDGAY